MSVDICLSIFDTVYATGALVFPPHATILEIGCAEADWMTPRLEERPDLQIVGIDWRATTLPGIVLRGDVLQTTFAPNTFDAIVGISSLEHIGLGHYDDDPIDPDGDVHCSQKIFDWLKPGGFLYADVPYSETYGVHGTEYRHYNERALCERLIGTLSLRHVWYADWEGTLHPTPEMARPHLMRYVAVHATKD